MTRHHVSLALATSIVLAACSERPAIEPTRFALSERDLSQLWAARSDVLRGTTDVDVIAYTAGIAHDLGVDRTQLMVAQRSTDELGLTHVRLAQHVGGVPVLGGDILVHLRGDSVFATGGTLVDHVDVDTTPALDADDARAALLLALADGPFGFDLAGLTPESLAAPSLVVVRTQNGDALAWRSSTLIDDADFPAQVDALVDAHDGAVLQAADVLETVRPPRDTTTTTTREAASGTGTSLYSGAVALDTTVVKADGVVTGYELQDQSPAGAKVHNMSNRQNGSGALFTDADNTWGDGTNANPQTAGVDAHFGATATYEYFKSAHGRNGIANDDKGALSRVHYGRNYNNAFWSDSCFCMTYGDGDGAAYKPFVALDVAGHEMSHGVTSKTAKLVYSEESGGLNEATSDIFGAMVERFAANANDPADWLVGEMIVGASYGFPSLRDMANPKSHSPSIDHYSLFTSGMNVHHSSGIANNFFYLISHGGTNATSGLSVSALVENDEAASAATAGAIWYRALTTYMTSYTNFAGARAATVQAATDLYTAGSPEVAIVEAGWAAVGVN